MFKVNRKSFVPWNFFVYGMTYVKLNLQLKIDVVTIQNRPLLDPQKQRL